MATTSINFSISFLTLKPANKGPAVIKKILLERQEDREYREYIAVILIISPL